MPLSVQNLAEVAWTDPVKPSELFWVVLKTAKLPPVRFLLQSWIIQEKGHKRPNWTKIQKSSSIFDDTVSQAIPMNPWIWRFYAEREEITEKYGHWIDMCGSNSFSIKSILNCLLPNFPSNSIHKIAIELHNICQ